MPHTFTSIGYAVERLREGEYFLARMAIAGFHEFPFELNAFLSTSRSVTFVLQKSLAHVPRFPSWYESQREVMKSDEAMQFFMELRNISQKEGPVSYVGGSTAEGGWSCRFVSIKAKVPACLIGRDIVACCAEHLRKLAHLVLMYFRQFPFDACPAHALTEEGMAALEFTLRDVEIYLGLPSGWTDVGGGKFSIAERLHVLRREVDPIDIRDLERLATGNFEANGSPIIFHKGSGQDLTDDIARLIESNDSGSFNPRELFLKAMAERIRDLDKV